MGRRTSQPTEENELLGPVFRAFRLVKVMSESDHPLTGKELSKKLDLPPSTVHRLLQLLARIEVVSRDADGQRYVPGSELYRIGFSIVRKSDIVAQARPFAQAVVAEFNITSVFWLYFEPVHTLMAVVVTNSSHPLDFREVAFAPRSLAWGSVGRSVLAYLPDAEIDRVIGNEPVSPTGRAMPSRAEMKKVLAGIRADGIAFSDGQTMADAVGFAAPVFDYRDMVIGCLSATMPLARYRPTDKATYASFIVKQAKQLSHALGYSGGSP